MARQLTDLGENVSDVTVMAKILASLTTKYSTLTTTWDSVEPAKQMIEYLSERFIREESRLNAGNEATSAATKQNMLKSKNEKKEKGDKKKHRSKKNIVCYRCQKKAIMPVNVLKKKNTKTLKNKQVVSARSS